MDEGNVGKDLAIKEKIESIVSKIKSGENLKQEELMISVKGVGVPLTVGKDEGESSHKIHALGVHILTLENGELSFNQGWEEELKSKTEGIIDSEDLINELKAMQAELEKQKVEQEEQTQEQEMDADEIKEEEQKDEEDLSKEQEQEELSEEQEYNKKENTIDETKQEIATRYRVSPNQVVHISMGERGKRVTNNDTMAGLTKWSEKYDDVFILPGEDEYSWQTIGVDKEGKEERINNRQMEGKNPNVTIKMIDENSPNKEIKEVRPVAMYEIDNKTSYAIVRDGAGKVQALYCRQEEGKGKEYWGHLVPEAQGKNVEEASADSRESISPEFYSSYDLSKRGESFEKSKSLDERGFPSKGGKGVQMQEIQEEPEQNRELTKEAIINDLAERAIASSPMPMAKTAYIKIHQEELSKKAERILSIGEEDADITYDKAIDKEAELTAEERKEEIEEQKLPGQRRGM